MMYALVTSHGNQNTSLLSAISTQLTGELCREDFRNLDKQGTYIALWLEQLY
jgi:hypothetical protein